MGLLGKKTYRVMKQCQNCCEIVHFSFPFGTPKNDVDFEKKCPNCGVEAMR